MARRLVSAADVRDWKQSGEIAVSLPSDAIITPEAADLARDLGIGLLKDGETPPSSVLPLLDGRSSAARGTKVKLVHARQVRPDRFAFDVKRPDMDIRATDVLGEREGSPMGAGIMSFEQGSFPWTLNYDEIDYIIEGELEIRVGDESYFGEPGDVIFIPRGTSIMFCTPSSARFMYVTFPANWSSSPT